MLQVKAKRWIAVCLALIAWFCVVDFLARMGIKRTGSYEAAVNFLQTNSILKLHCGELQEVQWSILHPGEARIGSNQGKAKLNFRVKGTKDAADVQLELDMTSWQWQVVDATMTLSGSKSRVMLTGGAEVQRFVSTGRYDDGTRGAHQITVLALNVTAFFAWLWGVYCLVGAVRQRVHGISLWTVLNPFSFAIFDEANFYPQAISNLRRALIAAAIFVILMGVSLLMHFNIF